MRIKGTYGSDWLNGTALDDLITGGPGRDTMLGGDGDDTIAGQNGSDESYGGAGDDTLTGGDPNNDFDPTINDHHGADGNDYLDGGSGNDLIAGGAGNDTMLGSSGADVLYGSTGADMMTGGDGADVFLFKRGDEGGDTITDWDDGDQLDFSVLDPASITVEHVGGDTLVHADELTITLTGIFDLGGGDFIL